MNYHNITMDDMLQGDGLRTVLWVSGCDHHCKGCQNPVTWDWKDGLLFDESAKAELFENLSKDYISGVTLSGGDPLNKHNLFDIKSLVKEIRSRFPDKTIWIYTGYTFEQIADDPERYEIVSMCDVLVDGRFVEELKDVNYPWCGSTNQRVINIKERLNEC